MRRTRTIRIGELIGDLFKDPVIRRNIAIGRLPDTFREAAGGMIASCTDSVTYKNGVLTARISSSVVRHEAFMRRGELRDTINSRAGFAIVKELIIR